MGTYIYGIVISVVMIAAGLSGQFSGGGSGINIPLVAFGVFFLAIDVMLLLRARKSEQQSAQAANVSQTSAEAKLAESNAEASASDQQQEGAVEVASEASAESVVEVPAVVVTETATSSAQMPSEATVETTAKAEN